MKNNRRFSLFFTIVAFLTLVLTGCSSNNSSNAKNTTKNQISVNYTLKEGKKTVDTKTVKIPKKKAKVITGLKKAWKVQETKGFVTAIDGKKQNPKKKIYWTYTINGKWASKGVDLQSVANKDKVKFTLDKVK
ncbi:DUF4430 domain-containing protein [Lactobacillus ultunensis]|uniref:Transcobalamin-like C-terminal domain-containing protein n=1 Tax=Lactobacillus ultunensis DSM 16047 TaxID=525365 RepID=C2ENR7_9LACO|nr:DUF4430 domain-containing protein [Lactobacillus ultunensis]EEJ71819.1 hypothetical protein HMPREF0548_1313 [Lactobacillus ultunensis DSM 16047]KRL80299.1 hypothetical protein FC57_GL001514 [Lactobacillus ultunensis DSM 16047]QQP28601.1 DUF4430 domain-containing protein [Lactobacillus ultunensis]